MTAQGECIQVQVYVNDFFIGLLRAFINRLCLFRCLLTTVDPYTGVKSKEEEPIKTLRT